MHGEHGEHAALRILLGNLIRNACFHTREGQNRITIDPAWVEVADTGVGLAPATLALRRGYRDPTSPGRGSACRLRGGCASATAGSSHSQANRAAAPARGWTWVRPRR